MTERCYECLGRGWVDCWDWLYRESCPRCNGMGHERETPGEQAWVGER